jgi:hypothetical protein
VVTATLIEEVLEAAARGESVIAVRPDKKTWYPWKPYQEKPASDSQLLAWARHHQASAFAVVTGAISNVVVLDFDDKDGQALLERLGLEPHIRTGSGGYHVRFEHPGFRVATQNSEVTRLLQQRWHGLDIRADGGYAIEWGRSQHGDYTTLRDLGDLEPIESLPPELASTLGLNDGGPEQQQLETPARRTGASSPAGGKITHPGRYNFLFKVACGMRGDGYEHDAILERLRNLNLERCEPPKPDQEVLALVADVVKRYPRGGPAGDRDRDARERNQQLCAALADAIKITAADLQVTGAELHGRGLSAVGAIHLDNGVSIEIDRYAQLNQPAALAGLVSFYTGVGESFTKDQCSKVAGLVSRLAAHQNEIGANEIAGDWGHSFLYAAPVLDANLSDQHERYGAWNRLADIDPVALSKENHLSVAKNSYVIRDVDGTRYVHSGWFHSHVTRDLHGLIGSPELIGRMCRIGWGRRRGRGRIKATEPRTGNVLFLPFLLVPVGWENE